MLGWAVMDINFLGHASFRLKGKSATVVTDPYDDSLGLKSPKVSADIVTVSHDHFDNNKVTKVSGVQRVIDGPGEYELLGVSVIGIGSFHDDKKGELRGKNTIFVIEIDGMRVVHLGDLGHKIKSKRAEAIGEVDILFVPVGGEWTIDASVAVEVVHTLEPKIIIPMHYKMEGLNSQMYAKLAPVEDFLSDLEIKSQKLPALKIKKEDLPQEEQIIYILEK